MKKNALSLALAIVAGVTISAQASLIIEPNSPIPAFAASVNQIGSRNIDPAGRSSFSFVVSLAAGQTFSCPDFLTPNMVAKVLVSSEEGTMTDMWTMRSYRGWNIRRIVEDNTDHPLFSGPWCFTAPTAGDYKFEYLVLGNTAPHRLQPDPRFTAVPESSTWISGALLGAVMLFGFLRNYRRVA